jgi:hypothetical protein
MAKFGQMALIQGATATADQRNPTTRQSQIPHLHQEEDMWFKHRAWIPVAWILSATNLVAVWFAALPGEPWHASIHALLAGLFGLGAQHLAVRRKIAEQERSNRLPTPQPQNVAQALDAIAVEVERIGEGQRYLTKLFAEREARLPENR